MISHHSCETPPGQQQVEPIAITGMGFICPVGANVWETARALREKRSSFFAHEAVLVADDRFGAFLRGATVSRVADEIVSRHLRGTDRAVALLSAAIRECTAGISPELLQPSLRQIGNLLEPQDPDFPARLQRALPALPVGRQWGETWDDFPRCVFFERIIQAVERLRRGTEQIALVGCADSLVTASRLEELLFAGRLKDAANPEGIMAGEAAGIILLEKENHARKRNATRYASIASWGRGTEPNPLSGALPSTGQGLTEAFQGAFAGLENAGAGLDAIIADLNGERHRALEWAYTGGRIFPSPGRQRDLRHPADTLGDCGGAMGVALMVEAVGMFMQESPPRQVALYTSDDAGPRRVICLERGAPPDRMPSTSGLR